MYYVHPPLQSRVLARPLDPFPWSRNTTCRITRRSHRRSRHTSAPTDPKPHHLPTHVSQKNHIPFFFFSETNKYHSLLIPLGSCVAAAHIALARSSDACANCRAGTWPPSLRNIAGTLLPSSLPVYPSIHSLSWFICIDTPALNITLWTNNVSLMFPLREKQ